MSFIEFAQKRQSCRGYLTKPVEREKLLTLIEAANVSPSACNSQPWRYVIVTQKTKEMAKLLQDDVLPINRFTDDCPAFIVVCEEAANIITKSGDKKPNQKYAQMDIGLSVAHLTLQATDMGLGTCILGWFNQDEVKEFLRIPKDLTVRLVVAVGYPKDTKIRQKVRKPLEEIVCFEEWHL